MISAKSLAALVLASTAGVVAVGGLPLMALVCEAMEMAVIKGVSAVGGALWEGARSEVVDFGSDTAASLLTALRRRLKIPRRRRR